MGEAAALLTSIYIADLVSPQLPIQDLHTTNTSPESPRGTMFSPPDQTLQPWPKTVPGPVIFRY